MKQNAAAHDGWLTPQRLQAAILCSEDELTDEAIAERVGVQRVTIWRWKEHPAFQAAVAEHRIRLETSISRFAIAKRRKRVEVLQKLFDKQWGVIEQRAMAAPSSANTPEGARGYQPERVYDPELDEWTDPEDKWTYPNVVDDVPGLNTGLITKEIKSVGYGDNAELVEVYRVDTALSAEIRNTLKQAAQEVGQWSERHEVTPASEELTQVLFVLPQKGSNPPVHIRKELESGDDA